MLDERKIAEKAGMKPIEEIAQKLGLDLNFWRNTGNTKPRF